LIQQDQIIQTNHPSSEIVLARSHLQKNKVVYQRDSNRWKPFILSESGIHYLDIIIEIDQTELAQLKAIKTLAYGIFCLYPVDSLPSWVQIKDPIKRYRAAAQFGRPAIARRTTPRPTALIDPGSGNLGLCQADPVESVFGWGKITRRGGGGHLGCYRECADESGWRGGSYNLFANPYWHIYQPDMMPEVLFRQSHSNSDNDNHQRDNPWSSYENPLPRSPAALRLLAAPGQRYTPGNY